MIDITQIQGRLKAFFSGPNRTRAIVIVGIIGIVIIMLTELIPTKADEDDTSLSGEIVNDEAYSYKVQVESELKEILGSIKGVGELQVMVTVEGTTEYVYAEELDTDNDKDGEKTSEQYQSRIVMNEVDGNKEALVKKVIKPQISGVIIVCQGGGDLSLKERLIKATSTALALPSGKICVELKK